MRKLYSVVFSSRCLAYRTVVVFLIGITIGNALPEVGTIVGFHMGVYSHIFNPLFLAIGIFGVYQSLCIRLK